VTEASTDGERQNVATQTASLRTSPEPIGLLASQKAPRAAPNLASSLGAGAMYHTVPLISRRCSNFTFMKYGRDPTRRFLAVVKPLPDDGHVTWFQVREFPSHTLETGSQAPYRRCGMGTALTPRALGPFVR
jgi:hypothetical protein